MTVYEKEMRDFLNDDKMLSQKVFVDKTVVGRLNGCTTARISFHSFGIADNYHGFIVQIINKEHGIVDTQIFRFSDIVGKSDNGSSPHLWEYMDDVTWAGGTLTSKQREQIMTVVRSYLFLYL